jgi:hypothetical protein
MSALPGKYTCRRIRESNKAALDGAFRSLFNARMPVRIPKAPSKKTALGFRRQELIKALKDMDREIHVLEYSIKVVAPGWRPPNGPHRGSDREDSRGLPYRASRDLRRNSGQRIAPSGDELVVGGRRLGQ